MPREFSTAGNNEARQQFDRARVGQAAANDQNQRDDDRCRMPESGKCQVFWYDTGQQCQEQREKRHQVIAPPAPNQENEDEEQ